MNRAVLAVVLATIVLPVSTQPMTGPVYMTGAYLLQLVTFPPEARGNLSPAQATDADRAYRYMDGVHDASAGKAWCDNRPHPPKPDTVYAAAIAGLRELPPPELKRNAAHLIVEIWGRRWPCTAGRSRQ